jgi:hypothetical protein
MRALFWVLLLGSLLWGSYWFIGSRAMEQGAETWFQGQRDRGLVAEYADLTVRGFPNRFDLTVDAPRLDDPQTGYGWTAPFVQVLSLSYKPWHVIAALPNEQTVQTPDGPVSITSGKLQASLVVVPGTALTLDRLTVVGEGLGISSGWGTLGAGTLRFATRQTAPGGKAHEIGLELLGITPDPRLTAALPDLPGEVERLHVDANVTLTAPLDRSAGETRPMPERVEVREIQLVWGPLALFGKGEVTASDQGLAEGRIDLRLTNWQQAVPLAVAAGLIKPEVAPTWENVLAALAAQSGDPADLDLPLVFANGRMSLGPLPLGPAPVLR